MSQVGKPLRRREDDRLIRGNATFIADLSEPDLLDAVVVRSPFARARITGIDVSRALQAEGVVAVLVATDLVGAERALTRQFYNLTPGFVARHEVFLGPSSEPILAQEDTRRVGEPVAFVVATSIVAAVNGAELVDVEYEPLQPTVDPEAALRAGSNLVDPAVPGNLQASFRIVVGSPEAAFSHADRVVDGTFRIARSIGSPIENRGVMAVPGGDGRPLTVWSTTQISHVLRSHLAEFLHESEENIRVIPPEIGGSFGGGVYSEEMLTTFAAVRLGRPVRWLEGRREGLINSRHSRDQVISAALAYSDGGVFEGLRMRIVQDCGSANPFGLTLPFNIASHARGQFAIDHFDAEGLCVLTNKTRNTPVRGAGRPEATFVLDRLVDMAASDLGMDPVELRRRNLIPPEGMPRNMGMLYRDGAPMVYDSGDYPEQLRATLEAVGYDDLRRRQSDLRRRGIAMGIGVSSYVEATGLGPIEGAQLEIDPEGLVILRCGSVPHGQSHETTLAQVAGDALGVAYHDVVTQFGDTDLLERGGGTFGSRSAVTAGSAVHQAASRLRDVVFELAASLLECDPADLVIIEGTVHPRGAPSERLSLREISVEARRRSDAGDPSAVPLVVDELYTPPTVTFGSGTHVATVVVDKETGYVDVTSYLVVEDCGTILNPMVVDGQQHGGVAHGIGNALLEEAVYDESGQMLSATFMDYRLPAATTIPNIRVIHLPHPTPLNPLGVKGAGEGSTASAPGAIANAIADALRPLRVEINEMPFSPGRLRALIADAEQSV